MPHTVLVVEDDEEVRESLTEALADEGYSVSSAANGAEALALLAASGKPCIVLLDLMMPVMDGWEFLQRIEKDPRLQDLKVCVVTAVPEKAPKTATRVLAKPVRLDNVIGLLQQYC